MAAAQSRVSEAGRFGDWGGRYVAETVVEPLTRLQEQWRQAMSDPSFAAELATVLEHYVGRPTPLYEATRLSAQYGRSRLLLKREDLCHTGAHKINNSLGQALLAQRMGKTRLIAETGAGQHGVATATAAARLGMQCCVYMGARDAQRQALNLFRIRLLGAEVRTVDTGAATLKEAMSEAMRDWVGSFDDSHYVIGSAAGPHPYPDMVAELQSVIGREAREQCLQQYGRLPDALVACVGGGSNAIGLFRPFLEDASVRICGVEAAGSGLQVPGGHAAPLAKGSPGILHGFRSMLLQDEQGQVLATESISAGLDYPGVGPEHAWLQEQGRAQYAAVGDAEALRATAELCRMEGILPALESAHAVAWALSLAADWADSERLIVVNLSGRGDKDVSTLMQELDKPGGAGR